MTENTEDYRTKLSHKAHAVLIARSRATGETQQEIGRRVIEEWAEREIHAATLIERLLRDEGIAAELEGMARHV